MSLKHPSKSRYPGAQVTPWEIKEAALKIIQFVLSDDPVIQISISEARVYRPSAQPHLAGNIHRCRGRPGLAIYGTEQQATSPPRRQTLGSRVTCATRQDGQIDQKARACKRVSIRINPAGGRPVAKTERESREPDRTPRTAETLRPSRSTPSMVSIPRGRAGGGRGLSSDTSRSSGPFQADPRNARASGPSGNPNARPILSDHQGFAQGAKAASDLRFILSTKFFCTNSGSSSGHGKMGIKTYERSMYLVRPH
jgi:hypothetical protein